MNKKIELFVPEESAGERADLFVSRQCGQSRSYVSKLIDGGFVSGVGPAGKISGIAKNYRLRPGDRILVEIPEPKPYEAEAEDIQLDVVYEDEDIIVINKPSGMVVHPAAGNLSGTLVNALLGICGESLSGIGGVMRPGIVHRIDKDTSGLLVAAKNDEAHAALSEQLKRHDIVRIYHAIVLGNFKNDEGTIDAPIGRHASDRKKMAVIREAARPSKPAVTHYSVIERFDSFTYLKCRLETGRTHQIRVHMSSISHPILGDPVYGGDKTKFQAGCRGLIHGQCLHAKELVFSHPKSGKILHFETELPRDMQAVLEKLRIKK